MYKTKKILIICIAVMFLTTSMSAMITTSIPMIGKYRYFSGFNPHVGSLVEGPAYGQPGEEYTFTCHITDIVLDSLSTRIDETDPIYYKFNWGDRTDSDWFGPYDYDADITLEASHIWDSTDAGLDYYPIFIQMKYTVIVCRDRDGDGDAECNSEPYIERSKIDGVWWNVTYYCENRTFIVAYSSIVIDSNYGMRPETPIKPDGASLCEPGTAYIFSTSSVDPNGDQIRYGWDWNSDLVVDEWTDFNNSGDTISVERTFDKDGAYQVQVLAKDDTGIESLFFSEILTIQVGTNNPPDKPVLISHSDGVDGVPVSTKLYAQVFDPDKNQMDVYFYDASDDSLIGSVEKAVNGEIVSVAWSSLDYITSYSWYVVADDSIYARGPSVSHINTSDVYSFTTEVDPNLPPVSWWNNDWAKRSPIKLSQESQSSIDAPTVLKIKVYYKDGMSPDFSDLRFISYDDSTVYDYYIAQDMGDYALIWVKLPKGHVVDISERIHMWVYYDNSEAESESDISAFQSEVPYLFWENVSLHNDIKALRAYELYNPKVVVDSQHNIILGATVRKKIYLQGNIHDPWYIVAKCDPNGELLWYKMYYVDKTSYECNPVTNPDCRPDANQVGDDGDWLTGIVVDKDDNIIVTGYSDDDGDHEGDSWPSYLIPHPCSCGQMFGCGEASAGYDFWTIKISPDGYKEWDMRFPEDNENGRVATGWNEYDFGWDGVNCSENWNQCGCGKWNFNTPPQFYAFSTASDSNGNILVAGKRHYKSTDCWGNGRKKGYDSLYLVMYTPNGEMLWEKEIHKTDFISDGEDEDIIPTKAMFDSNDNLIISGSWLKKLRLGKSNRDGFVMKLSTTGNNNDPVDIEWIKTFESDLSPDYYSSYEVIPNYCDTPMRDGDYSPTESSHDVVYEFDLDSNDNIIANTNFGVFKLSPSGGLLVQKIETNIEEYDPNPVEFDKHWYCVDADGDGHYAYPCGNDCNDNNYYQHPGAEDIINGLDDDCDGWIDYTYTGGGDDDDEYEQYEQIEEPVLMPKAPVPIIPEEADCGCTSTISDTTPLPVGDPVVSDIGDTGTSDIGGTTTGGSGSSDPPLDIACNFFEPHANVIDDVYIGDIGETIDFRGTVIYIGVSFYVGKEVVYKWNFGDGTYATGSFTMLGGGSKLDPCPEIHHKIYSDHSYSATGLYVATLDLVSVGSESYGYRDDDGAFVKIFNPLNSYSPVADANGPYSGVLRGAVNFDANLKMMLLEDGGTFSGSYDLDGEIISYEWDFGDGATGTGATPVHRYEQEGTYTATLTVTDDEGLSDTITTEVVIKDWPKDFSGKNIAIDTLDHNILGGKRFHELSPDLDHVFSSTRILDVDLTINDLETDTCDEVGRCIIVTGTVSPFSFTRPQGLYLAKYCYYYPTMPYDYTIGYPPNTPETPSGVTCGKNKTNYYYETTTTDPDGDMIHYGWDFNGDHIVDYEWTEYYLSGADAGGFGRWNENGIYLVSVMAEDEYGQQSGWSEPLEVLISPECNMPPVISDIPDQTVYGDESFNKIYLDGFVTDTDDHDSVLSWEVSGNITLTIDIVDRVVTITYPDGWLGSETVTFTVTDPYMKNDTDDATFTVLEIPNSPPVAVDDSTSTDEDTPVVIDILYNDFDSDGIINLTTVSIIDGPSNGNIDVDSETGMVTYTPHECFCGEDDTFTYTIDDDDGATSNTATVTITVFCEPENIPPVAVDDTAYTDIDTPVIIDVLFNDDDTDGDLDPATVKIVSDPSHGMLSVDLVSGDVTYTAEESFCGEDSFTYTVNDTEGATSNIATVDISVDCPSNDPPIISLESPANDAVDVTICLPELSATIDDPEDDLFDWSIETGPDIGSNSDTDDIDGIKTLSLSTCLEYDTTYTWYVNTTDAGSGQTTSEVFTFTTQACPSINHEPNKLTSPSPADTSTGVDILPTLNVLVSDPDYDTLNVSFYLDDVMIGTNVDVASESISTFTLTSALEYNTTHTWYVVVNDSEYENTSDIWTFKTMEEPLPVPTVNITKPIEGKLYFRNSELFSIARSIIIGYIEIIAEVDDPGSVVKTVKFLVDDDIVYSEEYNASNTAYSYLWNEQTIGVYTIKVALYDSGDSEVASDTVDVFILNLGNASPES